jgi:hypothetical protein
MNLTNADVIALRRVFGVTDVDRISKGRLVTANTSHMHFIDYMMVQLYKHEPTHELFNEFTVEQHKLMRKRISEEKRREYMMGPQSVGSKLKHSPKCTVEHCAEDCAIAAEGEKQLPEFSPSDEKDMLKSGSLE